MSIETSTHNLEELKDQVASDLERYLSKYKSRRNGLKQLSAQTGLHSKTIQRLIEKNNRPTYQTLFKIYRTILGAKDDSDLFKKLPFSVKNEIEKSSPLPQQVGRIYSNQVENEILYDRCFAEIYFMSSCAPVSGELIQLRFGLHGLETVEKMLELGALKVCGKNLFTVGEHQAHLDGITLKKVGLHFVDKYSKIENTQEKGQNLIGFFVEGLTQEAYQKWLKIDEDAFYQKINISNEQSNKGSIRAFTFMATDTMNQK